MPLEQKDDVNHGALSCLRIEGKKNQEKVMASAKENPHLPCKHCGSTIPTSWKDSEFCCAGCQYVFRLIGELGADKFYQLKPQRISPLVNLFAKKQELTWLDEQLESCSDSLTVSVEGIQCVACVWLIQKMATSHGLEDIEINTFRSTLRFSNIEKRKKQIKTFLSRLQDFSYQPFPLQSGQSDPETLGMIELGIAGFLAINSMMISLSMYVGLDQQEGLLFELLTHVNALLATISVFYCGRLFVKKTWQCIRLGVFHFDVPIAFGMVTAYLGSMYHHIWVDPSKTYFDTLTIFVFLMLLGRYLQSRWIGKNRSSLSGMADLLRKTIYRFDFDRLTSISYPEIRTGDRLLIPRGHMIPVHAEVATQHSSSWIIDKKWVTGETTHEKVNQGDQLLAGSRLIVGPSITLEALEDFDQSQISKLSMEEDFLDLHMDAPWKHFSLTYISFVLLSCLLGMLVWGGQDWGKALWVVVSICVVTCPCGIGIALPLARVSAIRRMFAQNVFIRKSSLLSTLHRTKTIIFDKTGTLTLSQSTLENPQMLNAVDNAEASILFSMVSQSHHPVSICLFEYLMGKPLKYHTLQVEEIAGRGLRSNHLGHLYYVGKGETPSTESATVFSKDGVVLVSLHIGQQVLDRTKEVFQKLSKQNIRLVIASGDHPQRVHGLGQELGLDSRHCHAQMLPEQKAQLVKDHQKYGPTLFIGDGLNDVQAMSAADHAGLAMTEYHRATQIADFSFQSFDLAWLLDLMEVSFAWKKVRRFTFLYTLLYNALVIPWAIRGELSPLVAAILMPLSSIGMVSIAAKKMKKHDLHHGQS
ncbi:MAG: heavy metal translocating P-type ATPase metal-binding domain-containing protein [Bdellovibrionota bacterium]